MRCSKCADQAMRQLGPQRARINPQRPPETSRWRYAIHSGTGRNRGRPNDSAREAITRVRTRRGRHPVIGSDAQADLTLRQSFVIRLSSRLATLTGGSALRHSSARNKGHIAQVRESIIIASDLAGPTYPSSHCCSSCRCSAQLGVNSILASPRETALRTSLDREGVRESERAKASRRMEGGMASETHGDVVIIGAGPAGLATGACLRARAVSFDIIEKDSTVASSWRARYERLRLDTVKRSSALPMVPFPREYPRYVPRDLLI